jgi:branched-subunit amino acid aminotransferase/4-amino-4-deoxychorismate lyase
MGEPARERLVYTAVHYLRSRAVRHQPIARLGGRANEAGACRTLVRHDLYTADECFLTGTAAEVIPVVEIDGRRIGAGVPGPVTKRLTADFHALVRR